LSVLSVSTTGILTVRYEFSRLRKFVDFGRSSRAHPSLDMWKLSMPHPSDLSSHLSTATTVPSVPKSNVGISHSDSIIGAAIFDLSGLPKEYFTTSESSDVGWVQTIFQALGLQSLLMSSLRLEGFHHAVIHGAEYQAVVVRQKIRYTALLICSTESSAITDSLISWSQEFEPTTLRSHPRFTTM